MKYRIRTILVLSCLLISLQTYSANDGNIFTKTTEWTPVRSDMSIGSSTYRGTGSSSHSYYGSENRSYRIVSTNTSHSSGYNGGVAVRGGSYAPRSTNGSSSYYQSTENYSFTGKGDLEYVENINEISGSGLPTMQRKGRSLGTASEEAHNPGLTSQYPPVEDAIPCLTIMILGVAIWKYRKMI